MATTGFWPVKGSLKTVIDYADNPDKTTNPKYLDDDLAQVLRYTENDENDMGYFVAYNLKALETSFQQLREYIQRKQQEKKAASTFMMAGNINQRQAIVLQRLTDEPDTIFTVKDVQELFSVSSMTARKDLTDLVQQGYLTEIAINKVTRGYIKMQEG